MVDTGCVCDALVTFAWAPRDWRPSHISIVVDGHTRGAADVARWTRRFNPSLAAAWAELGLARVNYDNCARMGHFGRASPGEAFEGVGVAAPADAPVDAYAPAFLQSSCDAGSRDAAG